jgi:hypothetical protein
LFWDPKYAKRAAANMIPRGRHILTDAEGASVQELFLGVIFCVSASGAVGSKEGAVREAKKYTLYNV